MTIASLAEGLRTAISAREAGRDHEAQAMLIELHEAYPDDAAVNLQCAWIHDKLGREAEAVPYYEKALALGVEGDDRQDALLGLGSTYRSLGRYEDALHTLTRGVTEFPDNPAMEVFWAMSLYNTGRAKEACETLLGVISRTDQPSEIARYQKAIAEYAADLDRTWL